MARPISAIYLKRSHLFRIPLNMFTRPHWYGARNFPAEGGFIVAANHVAKLDSMSILHFMVGQGIAGKILVKEELLDAPIIGKMLKEVGMIPVKRAGDGGEDSLAAATEALKNGEVIIIFPEGTLTRDPDEWPMKAKTGVARLALRTGVPVIPVGQWGMSKILPRYSKNLRLLPRQDIWVSAGQPVDLSEWMGKEENHESLTEATAAIMRGITSQLELLRGEKAPAKIFDRDKDEELSKAELGKISQNRALEWRQAGPQKQDELEARLKSRDLMLARPAGTVHRKDRGGEASLA